MRDLPLTMLRALAAVYEAGGVRPAGRHLGVTHSAVSRHLRELEDWLGTPVVEPGRQTRSAVLTPEGAELGRAALACLRDLDNAVARVRESRRPNTVTIATTPSFAVRWLLPRLGRLQTDHPGLEISVIVDQRPQPPRDEGADVSIRMGQGPWPDSTGTALMDDTLFPVMNPGYWREAGKPKTPADLARLRLLHDRDPNGRWAAWRQQFGPATLDVRRGARFTSSDLVLRAAEQGLGVALARGRLAADAIATGALMRPLGDLEVSLPEAYWLLFETGRAVRPNVSVVADWLMREARLDVRQGSV